MNIRSTILAVSTSAAVLAVTLLAAGPSAAGGHINSLPHPAAAAVRPTTAHPAKKGSCFSTLGAETQVGVVSQNFGSGNAFNAQGADDYALARRCRVSTVGIDSMVYNGIADSFSVTFYRDKGGRPGKVVSTATSNKVTACPTYLACDTAITLPSPVTLRKGVGWVSVVANLEAGEEFVWMTGQTQSGDPAAWQNPGDAWGTGCTTWTAMQSCWEELNPGPDFEYILVK